MTENQLALLLRETFDQYAQRLLTRMDGLTDAEYLWEPVGGCWSLRASSTGWVMDWEDPTPEPAPVTTIAWRLVHLIYCLQEHGLRAVAFERGRAHWAAPTVVPPSAREALAALERAVDAWRRDLSGLDDVRLWEVLGSEGGNYREDPVVAFVEHIHDEVIHHAAEVALLRDLYAHRPLHARGT